MSDSKEFLDQYYENIPTTWPDHDYDFVNVILFRWKDDDLQVVKEVDRFESLLSLDFRFQTKTYAIPSEHPGAKLNYELADFISNNSTQSRSLSIVYYAGHADDVEENPVPGYSEWRAKRKDGPTLDWSKLQQSLQYTEGDVLVILDCCRAALKTPRKRGGPEGKWEILAACGSDSQVPAPGQLSFTSILVREIRKKLKSGQDIVIKQLHSHLFSEEIERPLTVNPVHFDLAKNDQPSIVLKPLIPPLPAGFVRRDKPASSFIFLKVALEDDPTGLQIAKWIKSFPPKTIKGVDVEGLVLKARKLDDLNNHQADMFPGSVLGKLSPSAQAEILRNLWGVSTLVSSATAFANDGKTQTVSAGPASATAFSESVLKDLQKSVNQATESIEANVLLNQDVNLDSAAEDGIIQTIEANTAITLRQYLLDNNRIPDTPQLSRNEIKPLTRYRSGFKRFRYGHVDDKPVLIESFQYTALEAESSEPPPSTVTQIKRMVAQLSLPKRANFHILPCVGYFQEAHAKKFSVVFELSNSYTMEEQPTALCDLYGPKNRPALELRLRLTYALATALENFHRLGWVHKELKSENILFLHGNTEATQDSALTAGEIANVDFAHPYLFGFECSRPEDADSEMNSEWKDNAYRHPERWGKPRIKFEKYHDIYALGIVFLEIAFWKPIKKFKEMEPAHIDPSVMRQELLARAKKELPYLIGQKFVEVVDACLQFRGLTQGLDDSQRHREYKSKILDKLEAWANCF